MNRLARLTQNALLILGLVAMTVGAPGCGGSDDGGDSHIVFVVRDDASTSDLLFQTSDTTWQAYNTYGGTSTYHGPNGPAEELTDGHQERIDA